MADTLRETPRRAAYKAAEVCEAAHIQPYVLRSWESEFPRLGVVRGGVRIYRSTDLEQVLRIKQLVFEEGLTLAGARRRIEEDGQGQSELPLEEFLTAEMRQSIGRVKQGLQDLLTMLGDPSEEPAGEGRTVGPPAAAAPERSRPRTGRKTGKSPRGKADGGRRRRAGRA